MTKSDPGSAPRLTLVPSAEPSFVQEFSGKRAATSHRLLDACSKLIIHSGFKAVSITAIAEEVGITRQTVYRYFNNSDEIISATLFRAGREVLEAQYLAFRQEGEPRDLIVTAVMAALRMVTNNALLSKALKTGGNPRLLFAGTLDRSIAKRTVAELRRIGDRVGWSEEECYAVNEVLVRTVNSYLMMPPASQNESEIRAGLYKRLIPSLGL